ncbi:MAG TPA: Abi-alpha family protein [Blastocatellia bacterium]|nr:Abi-alpha family protein [Blastocatellia bacterium]
MPTPEPISDVLVKKGIDEGVSAAKHLLGRLCGPAVDEWGLLLQDRARVHRLKNQLRMLGKVQDMLLKAGTEVRAVPLRTLLPLLEGAALEDDENLSDKWAGLLASAASSGEAESTHPSFPRILSEVSPREALILDRLHQAGGETDWNCFREGLARDFSTSVESINQSYGNLFRLGLCRIKGGTLGPVIELGPFGRLFLAAAYGPAPPGT